ncbi:hypothetical protein HMI55_006645 [Coelomomyces lativittatus]|nr:hypothetical protein HMI56_001426 [Coelomomyces lativittatus]KAJ1511302.1 hypothetical protein HMI55_006645 [Coelomomyces lativittatus]
MEADDFEIAFEVLDVARVIYTSMLNGEMEKDLGDIPFEGKGKEKLDVDLILKQRLAEVISTLADVSLESESFTQAIEDYQKALLMKRDFLPPSDRRLAETHYKLALAIEYGNQSLDLALEHLKESRNVMVARQAELVGPQGQTERLEIDELILELDLKIEDLQNQLQVRQHPTSYSTFLPSETSSTPSTTMTSSSHSTTNVNDLSNLVKKKSHPSSSSSSSSSSSTVTKMTTGLTEETKRKRLLDEVEDQEEHDGMFNGSQPNEKEHLKHVRFK